MNSKLRQTSPYLRPALAAAIAIAAVLIAAPAANASTYTVRECESSNGYPFGATPDVDYIENTGAYAGTTSCTAGGYADIAVPAGTNQGRYTVFQYDAPPGTQIDDYSFWVSYQQGDSTKGNRPQIFERRVGANQQTVTSVNTNGSSTYTHTKAFSDATLGVSGPRNRIGIGISCAPAGGCSADQNTHIRFADNYFAMRDTSPPSAPSINGTLFSGWRGGASTVDVGHSDLGAGVDTGGVYGPNGAIAVNDYCAPAQTGDLTVGTLRPCALSQSPSHAISATSSVFNQGANTVTVCTTEFGTNPASACNTRTASIDTIAPAAPSGLSVAGGEGWRRDRDFSLSWSNPAQAHAPISNVRVRVQGPAGYSQTGSIGSAVQQTNIQVPNVVGAYTASVYLVDAAGNEDPNAVAVANLRFDDTVPLVARPAEANGWINRKDREAGYVQRWDRPNSPPISGVAGYRLVTNTNSDSDPCAGAADPRACGAPITHQGIDNRSQTLGVDALVEGANYAHVAAVSGSGMRASDVGHTELLVDLSDASTALQGAPADWTNQSVALKAVATDALSGMVDTPLFPDDAPPATFIAVDGANPVSDPDGDVSSGIENEGVHQVKFWARDLAGNENDGGPGNNAPGSATVKIDKTAPEAGFANKQDPKDPDQLSARVSDALSGVVGGEISYRPQGGEWLMLETRLEGDRLLARADSEQMREGVSYEFRARATDKAGNTVSSTRRENGEEFIQVGPFRTPTQIDDLRVNGKAKARLGYGKRGKVTGILRTRSGDPIAGAGVELVETYAAGSRLRRTAGRIAVTTDKGGRFLAKLPKGPSRSVIARYAGDPVYLRSETAKAVAVKVRGKVSMKITAATIAPGGKVRFNGRVKAKGAKFPKGGKRLEIQVRVGKKWKSVGKSFQSDRKGRYSHPYRFGRFYKQPTKFTFRAVVLKERSWPYLPAKSKKRSLTVVP